MDIEISHFVGVGDLSVERIVLKAQAATDVGGFSIYAANEAQDAEGGALSGGVLAYWFPDQEIKAGDLVVLYSRKGSRKTKELSDGKTVWFFYWGRSQSVWRKEGGRRAVLLEALDWMSKPASE